MRLYLEISNDEFGLPLRIADTAKELERMIGASDGMVSQYISRAKANKEWCRFIRVDTEGDYSEVEWTPHPRAKSVAMYLDGRKRGSFETAASAAKYVGRDVSSIHKAIANQGKCGGFYWAYEEE